MANDSAPIFEQVRDGEPETYARAVLKVLADLNREPPNFSAQIDPVKALNEFMRRIGLMRNGEALTLCGDSKQRFWGGVTYAEDSGWIKVLVEPSCGRPPEEVGIEALRLTPEGWSLLRTPATPPRLTEDPSPAAEVKRKRKRTKPGATPEWYALALTLLNDSNGGMSHAEIARRCGISKSTLSEHPGWKNAVSRYAPESRRTTKFEKRGGVRRALPNAEPNDK